MRRHEAFQDKNEWFKGVCKRIPDLLGYFEDIGEGFAAGVCEQVAIIMSYRTYFQIQNES